MKISSTSPPRAPERPQSSLSTGVELWRSNRRIPGGQGFTTSGGKNALGTAAPPIFRQSLRRLIDALAIADIRFAAPNVTIQLASASIG
jgi:hypothetical protein